MDKEALKKALLHAGLLEERDELFDENVTVRDWVRRHEDLVRSNRAIAQAVQADAPHDVNEGYFTDKDEQRQYDAGEKKYNEEKAKKQQLADEYQRAKDIKDFSKFRWNKVKTFDDAAKLAKDNLKAARIAGNEDGILECDEMLSEITSLYSKYERGERPVPLDVMVKLADLYGVSMDYLCGRSNHK